MHAYLASELDKSLVEMILGSPADILTERRSSRLVIPDAMEKEVLTVDRSDDSILTDPRSR